MFRSLVVSWLVLANGVSGKILSPKKDIAADSPMGMKLLSQARQLNNNNERDATWVSGYSIKYTGCSSLIQINGEEGGGGEESQLYTQHLVKFSLCPTGSCSNNCKGGGEYVVSMNAFVDAYTEAQLNAQEYACEQIRENCYCDNANDDEMCEQQCYIDAEMSECIEVEGEEEFEIQRYLECQELEGAENNNNNNYNYNNNNNNINMYQQYFVGPYCSKQDGKSIHLGVFLDEGCTAYAGSGVYEAFNYGRSLPFSTESIVKGDCMSCLEVDEEANNNNNNNNNNNQNQNDPEVIEMCERLYEQSARCENNVSPSNYRYFYPDNSGCEYINKILPRLEAASRSLGGGGGNAAKVFAAIFAVTTIALGAYAFFLYRKVTRSQVDLAHSDGALA